MRLLFTMLLLCLSFTMKAQDTTITAKFIGNCGLYLTDGHSHLYIDFPYKSGAHKYMEYDAGELDSIQENAIFLFTHHHSDHYSRKLMRKTKQAKGGKVFGNWNAGELDSLKETFTIEAIKTSHRFSMKHYSYVVTWHGKRFYFSGDTASTKEVSTLENIDWAFINPWLFMKLQRERIKIDTDFYALYHFYPTQVLPEEKPDNVFFLMNQGEQLILHKKEEESAEK
ncbi:hypothetical protein SAMN05216474_0461 [Lishizhenia tianjinensis]|uniref:Beta-lactamase superfamily domain-containing protein n=1 Tax=Lishizhenia tianjinensis TaxID=477690 RepID=A0A1I6XV75_9FLAO|nr:MBL fold metallo-hydrolase [Lishizhenia tianjinensis]SFT42017.1 hypothetical protein SAMN05216474_0461 [Lishizhenia tianjinensis]